MRVIRAMGVLSLGALLFLAGCGATAGGVTNTTTGNSPPAMDMAPVPAQTAIAASFTTSNLMVTPDKAKPGDSVMVGVTVTNTGTQQGTYTVVAKDHDGTLLGTKEVTLAGGAKMDVTLPITINATGAHMVMIDKLWQNLSIQQDMTANTTPLPPMPGMNTTTMPPTMPPATGTTTGFVVSGLGTDPSMPDVGESITVVFKVTNNSGKSGTYHAEVKIDGTVVATKDITLAAMETQSVNVPAKVPSKEGTFTVSVGDQTIRMTVMAM